MVTNTYLLKPDGEKPQRNAERSTRASALPAAPVEGVVTMGCPTCGRQIPIQDIRPDGFQCPWCKEHLQRVLRGGRLAGVAILVLACLVCYVAGAKGDSLLIYGVLLYLAMGAAYHLVTSIFWPKIERDPKTRDGFLHIVPPSTRKDERGYTSRGG